MITPIALAVALALAAPLAPQSPDAPHYTVTGEVVDMRGQPLADARVWAAPSGHHADRSREVQSDANGHFRIAGVPRTYDWRVHAEADGHCRVSQWTGGSTEPTRITLQQAVVLQGLVRDVDGAPVAGAQVFAQPTHRLLTATPTLTTTDENGWFVMPGVAIDRHNVGAWHPEHGLAHTQLTVNGPDEVSLRLPRAPATRVQVRFVGLDDEELQHAFFGVSTVHFAATPEHSTPFRQPLAGRAESTVTFADERLGVHAECLGVRFAPNRVTLEAGAGPHAVTFTARKPPAVDTRQHVRFVDARGEPVTEVRAAIYGADGQAPVAASSDARGHIAFDLHIAAGAHGWLYLRDGRWLIRSTGPLASPGDNHRFVVDPDAPLELELMPACSVAGRLLRPDGQPAAFARVELQREVGGHWQRLAKATSTANGDFACNQLRPHLGRLRIAVRCHHGTLAEEHERLTLADEGARVQLGELRLAPPAIVTGVLRRADGSPDAGRFVSLHGKGDADDYQEDTLTDAQGRFRFVGVAPGAGELYVRRGGGTRTPYQVAAGEAVEVTPK